jgi:hypothetical protein
LRLEAEVLVVPSPVLKAEPLRHDIRDSQFSYALALGDYVIARAMISESDPARAREMFLRLSDEEAGMAVTFAVMGSCQAARELIHAAIGDAQTRENQPSRIAFAYDRLIAAQMYEARRMLMLGDDASANRIILQAGEDFDQAYRNVPGFLVIADAFFRQFNERL